MSQENGAPRSWHDAQPSTGAGRFALPAVDWHRLRNPQNGTFELLHLADNMSPLALLTER
jgi:hypothetical protein